MRVLVREWLETSIFEPFNPLNDPLSVVSLYIFEETYIGIAISC